jgi:thiol-disulfide isomerase/thioredoxin
LTTVFAKDIVINNPVIDFNPGGVKHITKIVLTDTETRVHVLDKFIPGWWVKYERSACLVDNLTGKRYPIRDIIGGVLDERMPMNHNGSGDSARILIFPPIDKSVKKVDYMQEKVIPDTGSDNETDYIYGISLDPKVKPKPKTVPSKVKKWLAEETSKAKRKTLLDIDGGEFFVKDTARIVGYIKGYDRRAGFSSGNINYIDNSVNYVEKVTNEKVTVHEDGRFECNFVIACPCYKPVRLGKFAIFVYIEPGQTLSMIMDWEEFRKADRKRNISYIFSDIRFGGATAKINSEMCSFFTKLPNYNIRNFYDRMKTKTANSEFEKIYNSVLGEYDTRFQNLLKSENLQSRTKRLLQMYKDTRRALIAIIHENYDLPPSLKNDVMILAFSEIPSIIYLLESNAHIRAIRGKATKFKKSLKEYIHEELGLKQTVQDSLYYALSDSISKMAATGGKWNDEQIKEFTAVIVDFNTRYKKEFTEYNKIYFTPAVEDFNKNKLPQIEDSIFTNVIKIKPSLLYNLIRFEKYKRILESRAFTADEKAELKHSFADIQPLAQSLIDENEKIKKILEPSEINEKIIVNENPAVENEKLMETILEKYRGKVVFVNFWTTRCKTCFDTIKKILPVKEELQTNDLVFIHIVSESSPFDEWITKIPHIHGEHYRLTHKQWNFLYNELDITGMSAYLIYDRNGNTVSKIYADSLDNKTIKDMIEKELSK